MVPTFGWKARRLGVAVGKGYLSRQTASQNAAPGHDPNGLPVAKSHRVARSTGRNAARSPYP